MVGFQTLASLEPFTPPTEDAAWHPSTELTNPFKSDTIRSCAMAPSPTRVVFRS